MSEHLSEQVDPGGGHRSWQKPAGDPDELDARAAVEYVHGLDDLDDLAAFAGIERSREDGARRTVLKAVEAREAELKAAA